jgi:hypothetical protein
MTGGPRGKTSQRLLALVVDVTGDGDGRGIEHGTIESIDDMAGESCSGYHYWLPSSCGGDIH